jgi:N-acetylglucosamine kinase-like BadF-type ATPase
LCLRGYFLSEANMDYVLGVDGGNTKTIALVARLDGTIVGSGRGGCSDIYAARSVKAALNEIDSAVNTALRSARLKPKALAAGGFSMAGADWPEDFVLLQNALEQQGFGRQIRVVNDAIGGLYAGLPRGVGVSVVCGTGVAIGARGCDGRLWHSSWWQEPHGAYDLSRKTLRAVYRAELGVDPPTSLTASVLNFFQLAEVEQVLHQMTTRGQPPPNVNQLARVLLDEAQAGDATAQRIVREHGAALGDYALVAARRVGIEAMPFTLVLAGGVLRHPSKLLNRAIVDRVKAASPGVRAVASRFEPAVGALFMALEAVGVNVNRSLMARTRASLPPSKLFAT